MNAANKKVKKKPLIDSKIEYKNFKPVYLKFNFSFITYDADFNEKYQAQLVKRIRELSSVPYLQLQSWSKNIGIEIEEIEIKKDISQEFFNSDYRNFDNRKFAIFRLYTNDNPMLIRVIGRLINNIFYIFFIDVGGNLYKH